MRSKGWFHNDDLLHNDNDHTRTLHNGNLHKYHPGSDHKSNGIVFICGQSLGGTCEKHHYGNYPYEHLYYVHYENAL